VYSLSSVVLSNKDATKKPLKQEFLVTKVDVFPFRAVKAYVCGAEVHA